MPELDQQIRKALFYNAQGGSRPVPGEIIVANCLSAGYSEAEAREKMEEMVAEGNLEEPEDDCYLPIDE